MVCCRSKGGILGLWRLGFMVHGAGSRVQGSWFMVHGSGFRVKRSGFWVLGSGHHKKGKKNKEKKKKSKRTVLVGPESVWAQGGLGLTPSSHSLPPSPPPPPSPKKKKKMWDNHRVRVCVKVARQEFRSLGFRVHGSWFWVVGSGFWVLGSGFLGFWVLGCGSGLWFWATQKRKK